MKKLIVPILIGLMMFGAAFGGAFYFYRLKEERAAAQVQTVTAASLAGLQEQARLTSFMAQFVAVVTSKKEQLGLTAERTMIMPGTVRYEIDLKAIRQQDVQWDEASKTLTVNLPPLILSGPEIDIDAVRQYGEGGLLTMLTNAEQQLDATNRRAGQAELMKQAKSEVPMRLARDAARSAIERAFAMPLRAIGVNARVEAHFADEQAGGSEEGGPEGVDDGAAPVTTPAAGNATDQHEGGNAAAASREE